jgi:hypothetical protein
MERLARTDPDHRVPSLGTVHDVMNCLRRHILDLDMPTPFRQILIETGMHFEETVERSPSEANRPRTRPVAALGSQPQLPLNQLHI